MAEKFDYFIIVFVAIILTGGLYTIKVALGTEDLPSSTSTLSAQKQGKNIFATTESIFKSYSVLK